MNSVILDNANIAPRSLVGAGSIVKANFTCEESSLIIGSPAKVIRKLSNKEIKWKQMGTEEYQTLSKRCLKSLEECLPLPHAEENRKRMDDFIENTQLAPKN
jgi:phenylacetic acid degradation protein